jgi:predicted dehydrogenase
MSNTGPVGIAFVGCGNISGPYARLLRENHTDVIKLVGAYDIIPERTNAFAETYGVKGYGSMKELLADAEVEAALNITTHTEHSKVTTALLKAGKHVHSEKPQATTRADGKRTVRLAAEKGLLYGCSPAVILGSAQQTLKRLVREGAIGEVKEIYAEMNHGRIETWHPDPQAFYGFGAGPMLDVGCYPLNVITQIFGSAQWVRGMGGVRLPVRTIGSGPKQGQTYPVVNPDHSVALIGLAGGATVRLTTSFFGVRSAQGGGIELHGTDGSIWLESSAGFNSKIRLCKPGQRDWTEIPLDSEPYPGTDYAVGLRNLASAIRQGTPLTCPATAAYHVVDISLSAMEAARTGRTVKVASTFESVE